MNKGMAAFSCVSLKEELNGQIGAKTRLYHMILKTPGGNFVYILKVVSTTLKRISIVSFCSLLLYFNCAVSALPCCVTV